MDGERKRGVGHSELRPTLLLSMHRCFPEHHTAPRALHTTFVLYRWDTTINMAR